MSVALLNLVWLVKVGPGHGLGLSHKLVLLSLADHANQETSKCWPSVPRMARRTGVSKRQVQRCIKELELAQHITVLLRRGESSIYFVHPRPEVTLDSVSPATSADGSDDAVTPHPRPHDVQTNTNPMNISNLDFRIDLTTEQKADLCELTGRHAEAELLRERAKQEGQQRSGRLH